MHPTYRSLAIRILSILMVIIVVVQVDAVKANKGNVTLLQLWMQTDYAIDRLALGEWDRIGALPGREWSDRSPEHHYNYATMLVQQGEEKGIPDAFDDWQDAVVEYRDLLVYEDSQYAQHNLDVLTQLLEENGQEVEENQESGERSQEGGEGEESQDSSEKNQEGEGEEGGEEKQEGGEEGSQEGEGSGEQPRESGLSEEQVQQIEQYQEQLQQQQFQNQEHFGKQPSAQSTSVFDQLMGNQNLNDQRGAVEKDW